MDNVAVARAIGERVFPSGGPHGDSVRRNGLVRLVAEALDGVEAQAREEWVIAMRACGGDQAFYANGKLVEKGSPAEMAKLLFHRAYSLGHNHRGDCRSLLT